MLVDEGRFLYDPCGIFCIILVYLIIFYSNYAYLVYIVFFNNFNFFKFVLGLFYQIIIFFVFWTHSKASYCDPGVVKKPVHNLDFSDDRLLSEDNLIDLDKSNNWSICTKCETYRPPRAHHCQICQRCITKMDHHCPWINNCVGELNQKYFLQFLFYVGLLCTITLFTIFFEFIKLTDQNQSQIRAIHCIILLIESLLFGIFVIAVFTDQVQVLKNNQSSIDRYKNSRKKKSTISKRNSFKKIFRKGPIFMWLLPINSKGGKRLDHFVV